MTRNPLTILVFGLVFLLIIVPLGWLIRRADPLMLRRRSHGSYLRMQHGSATDGESIPENPGFARRT
ncbi:hypothetical protein M5C99_01810 [Acidovorax sp. NCPPB 2350]|nr:hypothetical protein M5C99_01810 [Acidovorax sp. NCPPB 2350]